MKKKLVRNFKKKSISGQKIEMYLEVGFSTVMRTVGEIAEAELQRAKTVNPGLSSDSSKSPEEITACPDTGTV